jgi:hypothetical protein
LLRNIDQSRDCGTEEKSKQINVEKKNFKNERRVGSNVWKSCFKEDGFLVNGNGRLSSRIFREYRGSDENPFKLIRPEGDI